MPQDNSEDHSRLVALSFSKCVDRKPDQLGVSTFLQWSLIGWKVFSEATSGDVFSMH